MKFLVHVTVLSLVFMGIFSFAADTWRSKVAKLTTTETKIKDLRTQIESLIKAKNATKDEKTQFQIVGQLSTLAQDLQKEVEKYSELRADLKYHFPERDDVTTRRYLPLRAQSLEEIENEMNIDDQLTKAKKKVDQKYAPLMPKDLPTKRTHRQHEKAKDEDPKGIENLKLTK